MAIPLLALSLLLAAPPTATPTAKSADPWAALRFLVGTWNVESGGGKPGEASGGGFTFAIELDGKVAVRRNRSEFAPRPTRRRGRLART